MVMTHSLIQVLTGQGHNVSMTGSRSLAPLLNRMPKLHERLIVDLPRGQWAWNRRKNQGQKIKSHVFDQAIVIPNAWKAALLPFWADIKKRTGWIGECRWGLLNDARQYDPIAYPTMIQKIVALAYEKNTALTFDDCPFPQLRIDRNNQIDLIRSHDLDRIDRPLICLCPGAAYGPAKRWPTSYFAQLTSLLIANGYHIVIVGSNQESSQADQMMQNEHCTDLTGKTLLDDVIDVLAMAECVVANDSGLMHVACAVNVPVVAIYGSTSPNFAPPLYHHTKSLYEQIPCQPCGKRQCPFEHTRCLYNITAHQVMTQIQQLIVNT